MIIRSPITAKRAMSMNQAVDLPGTVLGTTTSGAGEALGPEGFSGVVEAVSGAGTISDAEGEDRFPPPEESP
jgi:hypothetical protein